MPRAVVKNATGRVVRWGYCTFSADEIGPGESQVDIDDSVPLGVPRHYLRVVGREVVEIDSADKPKADADRSAEKVARGEGAMRMRAVVATMSDLPARPPGDGVVVRVRDIDGAGTPGIAISFGAAWVPFASI